MDSYFSRKTAIDVLLRIQRRVWDADVPGPYEKHHARMQDLINYIQAEMLRIKDGDSVEPAEGKKKGRKIKMSDADGVYYCCSECGEEVLRTWIYCPNCGAKMERRADDE